MVRRFQLTGALLDYDLLSSTNFENPAGVAPLADTVSNLSYFDTTGRLKNNSAELIAVVNKLQFDPRPPVFIPTNNEFLLKPSATCCTFKFSNGIPSKKE